MFAATVRTKAQKELLLPWPGSDIIAPADALSFIHTLWLNSKILVKWQNFACDIVISFPVCTGSYISVFTADVIGSPFPTGECSARPEVNNPVLGPAGTRWLCPEIQCIFYGVLRNSLFHILRLDGASIWIRLEWKYSCGSFLSYQINWLGTYPFSYLKASKISPVHLRIQLDEIIWRR